MLLLRRDSESDVVVLLSCQSSPRQEEITVVTLMVVMRLATVLPDHRGHCSDNYNLRHDPKLRQHVQPSLTARSQRPPILH